MQFSVLIPIYIKEKPEYLEECIKSIINQTLKPNQIVIIKDGKITKQLENVLEKYKDTIEVYGYDEQQGVGKALSKGVKYCKYEYIARMDADDVALKDRFEIQIKCLEQNPDVDILGAFIQEYDENMQEKISVRKVPLETEKIKEYIKTQNPFNHGTVIIKKSRLIECGSYRSVPLEDYDLWIRMCKKNYNMKNLDKIVVNYRAGKSMYKKRSGIKYIKKVLYIEKELLNNKMINKFEFIKNMTTRIIIALIPVCIKKYVYANIIRR